MRRIKLRKPFRISNHESTVNVDKLPIPEYIKEMYLKDSKIEEKRVELVVEGYKRKVDLFSDFQLGKSLKKIIIR